MTGVLLSTQTSVAAKVGDLNIAPTTTAADDLITAGQRTINKVWEVTQSAIALAVTLATLYVAGSMALRADSQEREMAFLLLSNAFFLVVSVYIQRTNHQKTGGVAKGDAGR